MAKVQKLVGLTATVIANMKSLKLSGLTVVINHFVQNMRVEKLAAGAWFRTVFILAAGFAFSALLFSPPLTFAFAQRTLDVASMFTSLSFLTLLTTPLSQLFLAVPELVSGLACLGRIQGFLECEIHQDFRTVTATAPENNTEKAGDSGAGSAHTMVIKDGKFSWEADEFVLRDINTRVAKSSLTAVVGPASSDRLVRGNQPSVRRCWARLLSVKAVSR
jgi:ABC-type multidrug transport system fused ATPase/permease subunit